MYKVNVNILLKDDVLDPQGKTVQSALDHMGYKGVSGLRIGKHIEFISTETDEKKLDTQVKEMANKVLINPVIEKFVYSIEKQS